MSDVELLQALIDQAYAGNQAAFARAIDRQPAQINQYLKGRRQLGVEVKMHIERTLQRRGWFGIEDQPVQTFATPAPSPDPQPGQKAGAGSAVGALEQMATTSGVLATLERLGELLAQATPQTRASVSALLVQYAQDPANNARIAQAIELLLSHDNSQHP